MFCPVHSIKLHWMALLNTSRSCDRARKKNYRRPLRLILGRWKVNQPSLRLRRLSMVCMLRTYAVADANFMQPPASTFVECSSTI
ncbi:hypothetical protein ACQJBY_043212 [Aegilops geniculata]